MEQENALEGSVAAARKPQTEKPYDRILRQHIEAYVFRLVERHRTYGSRFRGLSQPLARTLFRAPDYIKEVLDEQGNPKGILNLEIETQSDAKILSRMMITSGLLEEKYGLEVYPVLLYIGDEKRDYEAVLQRRNYTLAPDVIDMHSEDPENFWRSTDPGEVILATLARRHSKGYEYHMRRTLSRLQELEPNAKRLNNLANEVLELSYLRGQETVTKEIIKKMALTLDIRDSVLFQEGKKENQRDNILGMLAQGVDQNAIAAGCKVNLSYVQQLAQELQRNNK